MDEPEIALIAEQIRHANSLLQADLAGLRAELEHQKELNNQRLRSLEQLASDHETRLRSATDGVTQFKMWSGLTNGGASLLSIVAFVKAFFGVAP
jgi:hypothetical protein